MVLTQRKNNSTEPLRPILGKILKPGGGRSARRALTSLSSSNRRANLRLAERLLTISASEFRSKWNFDPLTETPLSQGQFLWTPMQSPTSKVLPLLGSSKLVATEVESLKTNAECDLVECFKLPQKCVVNRLDNGISVQPEGQTYKVKVQAVGETCKELKCLSVKDTIWSKINKNENTNFKRKLFNDSENNNLLNGTNNSRHQRQSAITEFLSSSKRPRSSPVSYEAPTETTPAATAATASVVVENTALTPIKLRRIMSDGDTS